MIAASAHRAQRFRTGLVRQPVQQIGQPVDPDEIIMADGYQRNVIAINDQMPGPVIEVMEGAEVCSELK